MVEYLTSIWVGLGECFIFNFDTYVEYIILHNIQKIRKGLIGMVPQFPSLQVSCHTLQYIFPEISLSHVCVSKIGIHIHKLFFTLLFCIMKYLGCYSLSAPAISSLFCLLEPRSPVDKVGLELLILLIHLPNVGITGISHCAWLHHSF